MAQGWGDAGGLSPSRNSYEVGESAATGANLALHPSWLVPNPVRRAKVSEQDLSQHETCDMSNAGTDFAFRKDRWADQPCPSQGREAVGLVGVTSYRGYE